VKNRRTRAAIAAVIISACATLAAGAQEVVEIRLRGRYYPEPATVRLTVTVEPDQSNRTLVVQADGDRLYRSSEVPLDGDKEQRIHTVEFKNLPAGNYVLRAEVHSSQAVRGVAEELLVVGDPGDQR
jgi:hypothetical protein